MNLLRVQSDASKVMALPYDRTPGYWQTVGQRLLRDKVAIVAALVILLLLLLALFGGMLTPSDPYKTSMLSRLKPIGTANFPLGTDELGRDMLSRLMVGAGLVFLWASPQ